ncbi:hypothetical protein EDC04DRAFT_2783123, partial [Pisolithus marmoratus]
PARTLLNTIASTSSHYFYATICLFSRFRPSRTVRLRFREVPWHPYSCCPSCTSILLLIQYVISFLCVILYLYIYVRPCFNTCTG